MLPSMQARCMHSRILCVVVDHLHGRAAEVVRHAPALLRQAQGIVLDHVRH